MSTNNARNTLTQKGNALQAAVNNFQQKLNNNGDIRYIKTGDVRQHSLDDFFFGSTGYWICLVVLALIFITLFVVFRQRAIENANVTKMRGKKANKVATKRLKKAASLMAENKPGDF